MFLCGIFAGVAAAFFQDCGYLFSRIFVKKNGTPGQLLVATQIWMGGVSLLLLIVVAAAGNTLDRAILPPLLGSAYGSLGGQLFFFRASKAMEPPQISSLMGLRVALVALAMFLVFQEHTTAMRFAAILLAVASAFVLNWNGRRLEWRGMGSLTASLLCYCVSDLSVMHLVRHVAAGSSMLHGALAAMTLVNLLLAVSVLPWAKRMTGRTELRNAAPFSIAWLLKQFLLYFCYGVVGPVFGNVILSLRGPMAFAMTAALERIHPDGTLCAPVSRRTRIRRLTAILMMTAAVILYSLA